MENKNIHSGHRERFRQDIKKIGMYNLSDVHFLEYLLTFTITRADTNPIAHALIKEFGSIDEIFNASYEALISVKGIGDKTARFLQTMGVGAFMYNKSNALKKPFVGNLNSLIKFLKDILPPTNNEQFVILIVTKNSMVKNYKIFKGVSHSYVDIDARELTEYLVKHKASFCIFAHTHPDHDATPSMDDSEMLKSLYPLLNAMKITLQENIILGGNNVCSYASRLIRPYNELVDFEYKDSVINKSSFFNN